MNRLILDTETANGLDCPLPYDIGYCIFDDSTGEPLIERSFVVAEIFLDNELMGSAYYADKVPQYWDDITEGVRSLRSIRTIRRIFWNDLKTCGVKAIGGYNMGFDTRAVRNDIRYITASFLRWFIPYGVELFDIWNMACTSILSTHEYIDFALVNNLVSAKGNILTSAEAVYKYLQNDADFAEAHTGLEDVRIEKDIYFAVKRSGLNYDETVKATPWMKVRKYYKNEYKGE